MKEIARLAIAAGAEHIDWRTNSFTLLGLDYMLSSDLRPWLIEVNSSPTLVGIAVPHIVDNMVDDLVRIVIDDPNSPCGEVRRRRVSDERVRLNEAVVEAVRRIEEIKPGAAAAAAAAASAVSVNNSAGNAATTTNGGTASASGVRSARKSTSSLSSLSSSSSSTPSRAGAAATAVNGKPPVGASAAGAVRARLLRTGSGGPLPPTTALAASSPALVAALSAHASAVSALAAFDASPWIAPIVPAAGTRVGGYEVVEAQFVGVLPRAHRDPAGGSKVSSADAVAAPVAPSKVVSAAAAANASGAGFRGGGGAQSGLAVVGRRMTTHTGSRLPVDEGRASARISAAALRGGAARPASATAAAAVMPRAARKM
jgi:hypothetical protein